MNPEEIKTTPRHANLARLHVEIENMLPLHDRIKIISLDGKTFLYPIFRASGSLASAMIMYLYRQGVGAAPGIFEGQDLGRVPSEKDAYLITILERGWALGTIEFSYADIENDLPMCIERVTDVIRHLVCLPG